MRCRIVKFPLILILLMVTYFAQAQYGRIETTPERQEVPKQQRWFAGGMVGGSFSSYGGSFELAPIVGYRLTNSFDIGSRITYIYSSYKNGTTRYNFNDYGASLFGRYRIYRSFFAQAEYELLSIEVLPYYSTEKDRRWLNSLFVGGGYMQSLGGSGFTSIAVLFNLLENEDSQYVYTNPIIRIGFGFGF